MDSGSFRQLQVLLLATVDQSKKLNPFIVGKSMKDLVGEIESATTEANGSYLLRVRNPVQVKKLLELKEMCDETAVSVTDHPRLTEHK